MPDLVRLHEHVVVWQLCCESWAGRPSGRGHLLEGVREEGTHPAVSCWYSLRASIVHRSREPASPQTLTSSNIKHARQRPALGGDAVPVPVCPRSSGYPMGPPTNVLGSRTSESEHSRSPLLTGGFDDSHRDGSCTLPTTPRKLVNDSSPDRPNNVLEDVPPNTAPDDPRDPLWTSWSARSLFQWSEGHGLEALQGPDEVHSPDASSNIRPAKSHQRFQARGNPSCWSRRSFPFWASWRKVKNHGGSSVLGAWTLEFLLGASALKDQVGKWIPDKCKFFTSHESVQCIRRRPTLSQGS